MMDSTAPTRVLVVDDSPAIRSALSAVIASHPHLDVVGTAGDGAEGVDAAARLCPDVVLIDFKMPRMDGVEATRAILAHAPATRIVMLSAYDDMSIITAAVEAGVDDFLRKGVRAAAMHDALLASSSHPHHS